LDFQYFKEKKLDLKMMEMMETHRRLLNKRSKGDHQ